MEEKAEERKVGRELKRLNNLMSRRFERDWKCCMEDATVMHGWILVYIETNEPREVFQRDIEREFNIAKSTATSILKLMERKGLITRASVEYDERLKRLCLTDKGRGITQSMRGYAEESDRGLTEGIPPERLAVFYEVLDRIRDNIETQL